MTSWIDCGVIAWIDEKRYGEDETVLVYFKGTSLAAMAEGLSAQHRPPFAYGNDTAPGGWGVIVHHMFNPSRDDYDGIDYRELCPQGAELMVFVPNPCIAKAHGPKGYHYKDGQISSCIDYEGPDCVGEYWPNKLAPLITAAGLDHQNEIYEEQLTQLICDHLGLPALDRDTITVDRDLVASYL
ncbi:hypothetical protein [Streptomyces sp. CB01635]|uniref:hypothetical protein n=1 Tax=unclassified Streptomyces TaxID=2593676 RepID=UPI001F247018|nr:hypothetical protein [Streptomyces sp. CB01635]